MFTRVVLGFGGCRFSSLTRHSNVNLFCGCGVLWCGSAGGKGMKNLQKIFSFAVECSSVWVLGWKIDIKKTKKMLFV